jgi:fibronectin type 3 domain-containing protein
MRRDKHSAAPLHQSVLIALVAVSLLSGCGRIRRWYEKSHSEPDNPHSVTIAWTASTSSVEGYNVYRIYLTGPPQKLTVRLVNRTQYTDKTVEPGRTYTYFVTAVDFNGRESRPSTNIAATVPATVAPAAQK